MTDDEGFLTLYASDILTENGLDEGRPPYDVMDWYCHLPSPGRAPDDPQAELNRYSEIRSIWSGLILPDLIRYLLLPLIPFPVQIEVDDKSLGFDTLHASRVGDLVYGADSWDEQAARDLLDPYQVTFALPPIIDYITHRETYLMTERSTRTLLLGLLAGLCDGEIIIGLHTGTLPSPERLGVLAGLMGNVRG